MACQDLRRCRPPPPPLLPPLPDVLGPLGGLWPPPHPERQLSSDSGVPAAIRWWCASLEAGTQGAGLFAPPLLLKFGEPTVKAPEAPAGGEHASKAAATAAPALMLSALPAPALPPSGVPGMLDVGVLLLLRQLDELLALGLLVIAQAAAAAACAARCAAWTGLWQPPLLLPAAAAAAAAPAADMRVGVLKPPPACDDRAPPDVLVLALGEPDCGGVITPANAAATAAAGDDEFGVRCVLFLPSTSTPRPLLLDQRPLLLLRLSRVGVLPVGADKMLSISEATSGGAGDLTVRGLPMLPPMPPSTPFMGLPTLTGLCRPAGLDAPAAEGDPGMRPPPWLLLAPLLLDATGCVRMGVRCIGRPAAAAAAAAEAAPAFTGPSEPLPAAAGLLLPIAGAAAESEAAAAAWCCTNSSDLREGGWYAPGVGEARAADPSLLLPPPLLLLLCWCCWVWWWPPWLPSLLGSLLRLSLPLPAAGLKLGSRCLTRKLVRLDYTKHGEASKQRMHQEVNSAWQSDEVAVGMAVHSIYQDCMMHGT